MNDTAQKRPLLFISHRHADAPIASVLARFVRKTSGGRVEVFQSSSVAGASPKIGKTLKSELLDVLWRTDGFVLIYTEPDHDWSYCMWECGVATDPHSPGTRLIVLQCSDSCPPVFADQVRVNVRSRSDVEKFVSQLLTEPDFFPAAESAVAPGFAPGGEEVREAAEQLFNDLQKVAPPCQPQPDESWPVFPCMRLELSETVGARVAARDNADDNRRDVLDAAVITGHDRYASVLFGMASFPRGFNLTQLQSVFRRRYPNESCAWVASLCDQMVDGCRWEFPRLRWETFRIEDDQLRYAPMVTTVRKSPSAGCYSFEVYFYKFTGATPTGDLTS